MSSSEPPYVNHLNILHKPLELIDAISLTQACKDQWYSQTLCQVNDSVVRLGIVQGEYYWHKHDEGDEFFFMLEGKLIVDIEDGQSIELRPQQGYVVPKGVVHRTRAPEKSIMLMVKNPRIIRPDDA